MMKNSSLLKWTNSKNNKNKNANKNWIHPPEALQGGHIAYLVKFLGETEVSESKGIEVVKEAITKLRFNQQIKKTEGSKIPKVELTISVDGVAIQHPKTKKISFQYPLHQISYCADDKAEKRFFSFIAKENDRDVHTCFVFVSDKLAEEITLTIGQAFDLAYKKFLETSNREGDLKKQLISLKQQLHSVQQENKKLKDRLTQIASVRDDPDLNSFLEENNGVSDLLTNGNSDEQNNHVSNHHNSNHSMVGLEDSTHGDILPPVPPRNLIKVDVLTNGSKNSDDEFDFDPRAEERGASPSSSAPTAPLCDVTNGGNSSPGSNDFTHSDDDDDFDPRAEESDQSIFSSAAKSFDVNIRPSSTSESLVPNGMSSDFLHIVPPPRPSRPQDKNGVHNQGGNTPDPFSSSQGVDILNQFDEMKVGFGRGISFGTTDNDFTLDSLDPLKN